MDGRVQKRARYEMTPMSMYVCRRSICTALVCSIPIYCIDCTGLVGSRGVRKEAERSGGWSVECGVSHRSGEEEIGSNPGAAKGEVPSLVTAVG
jgi:hypothetical protein